MQNEIISNFNGILKSFLIGFLFKFFYEIRFKINGFMKFLEISADQLEPELFWP